MRLTEQQIRIIKSTVCKELGDAARVRLFGSRMDDLQKGGDIDLLVETDTDILQPALVAARIEAGIICQMGMQKVDVLLSAPNLRSMPVHQIAAQGIML